MSDQEVGCDAHKLFSLFAVLDSKGRLIGGAIRDFLSQFPVGTAVALESVGPVLDRQRDRRGLLPPPHGPRLQGQGHDPAARQKRPEEGRGMMRNVDKTDKLDAEGAKRGRIRLGRPASLSVAWLQTTVKGLGPPGSAEITAPYTESGERRPRV